MQVMISRCLICKVKTGCFVSTREPQRKYCKTCTDECLEPTGLDSHGFCLKHYGEEMERINARKLRGMT